jgi:hypothetical protein
MKRDFRSGPSLPILAALIVCTASVSFTQNREKYVISVKAGGVNSTSGDVKLLSPSTEQERFLTAQDDLNQGDTVRTGADGRVEVLLNPGTYMRMAENSEFKFEDTSLENLRLRLVKGCAIVEATGDDQTGLLATIDTPQTKISILRRGIYRINVLPADSTELIVHKGGRAFLGTDTASVVKDGKKAIISGGSVQIAKAENDKDSLDVWSRDRAQMLAKANRSISGKSLASAFTTISGTPWYNSWYYGRSAIDPRLGLWWLDPTLGYTFLPPYGTASSPYGFDYRGWPIGYAWGDYWSGGIPIRRDLSGSGYRPGGQARTIPRPSPIPSVVTASEVRSFGTNRTERPGAAVGANSAGRPDRMSGGSRESMGRGEARGSSPAQVREQRSAAPMGRPSANAPARTGPGRRDQ